MSRWLRSDVRRNNNLCLRRDDEGLEKGHGAMPMVRRKALKMFAGFMMGWPILGNIRGCALLYNWEAGIALNGQAHLSTLGSYFLLETL